MRHIRWQLLIAFVGVTFLSVLLAYLAFSTTLIERPDAGGTYIEGIAGRPNTINPIFSQYNDADRDIVALVFSGLTRADENGTLQPELATRWTISPDGLLYTVTLRADVVWHDGAFFSADDVLYTIHALQDPAYKGPPDLGAFWRTVAVARVDDLTIRFQLTQPYAPFLDYTTIGILPAHLLKDVPPAELFQHPFNRRPIGTGPFHVIESTAGQITLEANPRFYGARPYLNRVILKFYPDHESVFAAYTRAHVEGIARVLPAYLPKARAIDQLKLYHARIAGYSLVYLNLSKPAFQDKAVRQALLYAIDRQRLIDHSLQGQGRLASSPIAPDTWAYNPAAPIYPFDPERAKALLDGAGWRDPNNDGTREKDRVELAFNLIAPDDPTRLALANEIVKQWQAIGVKAAVQPVPTSLLVQNVLRPRQFDAVLYEWRTLSNDPDQYENWHESQIPSPTSFGQNYSGLRDRDLSEALETARRTNDHGKRTEAYRKFQERFADLTPALLLYYPIYTYGVDARVREVKLAPLLTASDRFRNIAQWYLKTKRIAFSADASEPTRAPTGTRVLPPRLPTATTTPLPTPTAAPTAPPTPGATPAAAQCANLAGNIKSPTPDAAISGTVEIRGSATRPNLTFWKLEYRADAATTYTQLYRSDQPVADGALSLWSTRTLPNGVYWLQLTVADNTGNVSVPCQVRVTISN
ncbi:MAG: peptide ABC transporter substrate-binding protein [Chloroflexi bacterium]|nr:peptide ABC transporter substrate-binding protein [Chloroflexota bacterium]